jgi:hypothetical protein
MPEIQIPSIVITGLQVILAFTGAFFIALWLSLIVWTFRDARSRSRDIFAILLATLMVVVFGPLGLLIYFLLRPPVTLAELYERSLEEEALLQDLEERPRCPGCSRQVNEAWIVCPDCHTTLKSKCPNCQSNLHLAWNICPFCGESLETAPTYSHDYHGPSGYGEIVEEPTIVTRREAATQPMPVIEMPPTATPPSRRPPAASAPSPVLSQRPISPRNDETKPQIPQTGPA